MRLLALLPALALTACGMGGSNITEVYTDTPPAQSVRVGGVPQPVTLAGRMESGRRFVGLGTVPKHDITITLDGQQAAAGTMETYRGGPVSGTWRNMPVSANCVFEELGNRASRRFNCPVTVNQQPVGTLSFSAYGQGLRPQTR